MSFKGEDADNHKVNNLFIPYSNWGAEVALDGNLVKKNLLEIKKKVVPLKPRIIGVTKYFGVNAIEMGYNAGLRDFGESRALDAIDKIKKIPLEIRENSKFHFIGHLQTNKVNRVVEYFDYIHSVDSLKLAKVISDSACRLKRRVKVLLQVNNACEEKKYGYLREILWQDFPKIIDLDGLEVVGLMNMAVLGASELDIRNVFRELRLMRDDLERDFGVKLSELSMGMSDDFHIAVEEGATMIRIGRKLFK